MGSNINFDDWWRRFRKTEEVVEALPNDFYRVEIERVATIRNAHTQ